MGKQAERLVLSPAQRKQLERIVARPSAPQGHVRRARVILMAADGLPNVEIARRVGFAKHAITRIRKRFARSGVEGLPDRARSGSGKRLPDATVLKIIATALSRPPAGYSHWSAVSLAKVLGVGKTVVHKVLRANDIKPHLTRTVKVSRDPRFDEKATDIVGLYLNPPEKAVVLCLDEKTQVQALERTQPMLPLMAGQVARHTHDYKRNGVIDLYAALEVATGRVTGQCADSHTGADFLAFMNTVVRAYPRRSSTLFSTTRARTRRRT